ncbi:IclR family transcriptional regulator [Flavobacterium beibuense F44-8]|uniref:IclR family transcriptional regulator n=1 Tax=Flavobacterium beibuense F44-8 TaxID=1406840 RepID=A0A0A2LV49_9FLAO|nr:uracil-DNA glycosylase family protein [Flavobacterium beibuense]KGO83166.1 IclR family transcriptional regulator [Flavobacterium beibuense F44-8]
MNELLSQIQQCTQCKEQLPFAPKPVVQAHTDSKIIIIGQAPGLKVQNSGIPWDDQSGNELRRWLNVTKEQFYNPELFALIPMGFCYPGRGKSGDLPPRPECAPLWHQKLLETITNPQLILLIGQYAQKYYLGNKLKPTLTDTVKAYSEFLPHYLPLVHPSPRNKIWQKKNPWFEQEIVPQLQVITGKVMQCRD